MGKKILQYDVLSNNKVRPTFVGEQFHIKHFAIYFKSVLHALITTL